MFISEALVQLQGRTDLFAWRVTGEMIQVTNRGCIKSVRCGRPSQFAPKISDLLSNDWRVGTAAKLRQDLGLDYEESAA